MITLDLNFEGSGTLSASDLVKCKHIYDLMDKWYMVKVKFSKSGYGSSVGTVVSRHQVQHGQKSIMILQQVASYNGNALQRLYINIDAMTYSRSAV